MVKQNGLIKNLNSTSVLTPRSDKTIGLLISLLPNLPTTSVPTPRLLNPRFTPLWAITHGLFPLIFPRLLSPTSRRAWTPYLRFAQIFLPPKPSPTNHGLHLHPLYPIASAIRCGWKARTSPPSLP